MAGNGHQTPQGDGRLIGLVLMLSEMAMMAMGKIVNPSTGEQEINLEQARVFIDIIEMLDEKMKGNLNHAEEVFIQTHLTNLRLNFVNESGSSSKKPAAGKAADKAAGKAADKAAGKAADKPVEMAADKREAKVVETDEEGKAKVVDKRASAQPD